MKTTFTIIFILTGYLAMSQNVASSKISWTAAKSIDTATGKISMDQNTLITYGQDSLVWKDKQGQVQGRFKIKQAFGTWTNLAAPGEMSYKVGGSQKSGTITIKKTASGTKVKLLLVNKEGIRTIEFFVTASQVLQ